MNQHPKNTYEVQVAGTPLKLRTSHDEATVNKLVDLVNKKVELAMSGNQSLSFQKALLLASLNLAEDLVMTKQSALGELDLLEAKAKDILSDLESSPISRIRMDN